MNLKKVDWSLVAIFILVIAMAVKPWAIAEALGIAGLLAYRYMQKLQQHKERVINKGLELTQFKEKIQQIENKLGMLGIMNVKR